MMTEGSTIYSGAIYADTGVRPRSYMYVADVVGDMHVSTGVKMQGSDLGMGTRT